MGNEEIDVDTMTLLGTALFMTQRLEFALYGIAAHCSHLPEAQREKRFRELNPEKFLRGDISELKSTLGQITTLFGERFLIAGSELDAYIRKRNDIVHNFWRLTSSSLHSEAVPNPKRFLWDFILETKEWQAIVGGLLANLKLAASKKEGREGDLVVTELDLKNIQQFEAFVAKSLIEKNT